ncbi:subtilisin family serine protease [Kribbella amoyensis]|uniref:Subtilisin family serine protease n=1 Tax=Kribbella amoyensis TaxID=996641 RepID=A0A561BZB8_9ACTN|nr:S8 family serine peptidase [Kribbella amoyensis]TWD84158.1 subtilisin family serine protease [Kribbella amoyensis]
MSPRLFRPAALLSSVALLIPLGGASATASVPSPGSPAGSAVVAESTVTLLTGDRVVLGGPDSSGEPAVTIDPRTPGTSFSVRRDEGRVTVIPSTVANLVPDVLDPALFDVTGLVEMEYDDAHRSDLPVITQGVPAGLRAAKVLRSVGASAGTIGKDASLTNQLTSRRTTTGKVWLDKRLGATGLRSVTAAAPDPYLNQVKAPAAWAQGLDGRGVKVAVLDTGADSGHPALAGKVAEAVDFTGTGSAEDDNGHGTHVSSLIVGNGAGSDGARQGIAPAAELLSGKVLAADGFGQESWVIAGMEWAAEQGADLVNLSLSSAPADGDDLVSNALERLTAQYGTLFVAAAGNRGNLGSNPYTIGSPGVAASALTVGAVDGADKQALFSSEGPTRGTYRLKPDLSAPGVNIPGAKAGARDGSNLYVTMSGTSQATPLVTGAAALMLQRNPAHTWQQLKSDVVNGADISTIYDGWTSGGGRLDLARASAATVTSDISSFDLEYLRYPEKGKRSRVVTLTNTGSTPVTLPVTDAEQNSAKVEAPADAVVASPAELTVPAGGTASTTITVDPALLPDGFWQGGISFGDQVRLAFGAYDEPERYDLTVKVLDRSGAPYAGGKATVFNYVTGGSSNLTLDANGTAKVRLDPGRLSVLSAVTDPAAGTFALAGTAEIPFGQDTTFVADARKAQQVRAPSVAGQPTRLVHSAIGISRHSTSRGLIDFYFFTPEEIAAGKVFVQPTTALTGAGSFEASNRWRLEPVGTVKSGDAAAYELLFARDRFSSPLAPAVSRRDLTRMARVDSTFGSVSGTGPQTVERAWSTVKGNIGWVNRRTVTTPTREVELLTAEPGSRWNQCMTATTATGTKLCDRENLPFAAGARIERDFGLTLRPTVAAASHTKSYLFVDAGLGDTLHSSKPPATAYSERRLALYRDGALVSEVNGGSSYFQIPNGPGRFRLEQSWTLDPALFPRSGRAQTTWDFTSTPPDPTKATGVPPALLDIGYDADVDGLGRAAAWRPMTLDLVVGHLKGSTASRVTGASLWYSTDGGKQWTRALTVPIGSRYRTIIPPWALVPGKSLSLRAVATDAAGGRVEQTVLDAVPTH